MNTPQDPFFTSDPHYGHAKVIQYCNRPYPMPTGEMNEDQRNKCAITMNEDMILRYNNLVRPDDTVFMLGDFSLGMGWVDRIGPRLMGNKMLVPGNHDWIHSAHNKKPQKQEQSRRRYVRAGFTILPEQHVWIAPTGEKLLLCHLPYWEDGLEKYDSRYRELRPVPGDEFALLCGHVHEKWKCRRHESGKLMYNVGVDRHNLAPVRWSEIRRVLLAEETDDRIDLRENG